MSAGLEVAGAAGAAGASGGGGSGGDSAGSSGAAQCATNLDCVKNNGGGEQICKAGACVSLTSPQCIRTIGSVADGPTQFIGLMLPQYGKSQTEGDSYLKAIQTAYNEYKVAIQSSQFGVKAPELIVCDEREDPEAAANHLLNEVGVKVMIGPSWGVAVQKVLPLLLQSTSIGLLPLHDDPSLTETSSNGRVWGCRPNRASVVNYWQNAISAVEQHVVPKLPSGDKLRVALVTAGDTSSQGLASRVLDKTTFNGVSRQENETANRFFQLGYDDYRAKDVVYPSVAGSIVNHPSKMVPNLIIIVSSGDGAADLVPAIEKLWPPAADASAPRPTYLIVGGGGQITSILASQVSGAKLENRILSLDTVRDATVTANYTDFVSAFKTANSGQSPIVDAEYFYDCFWLNQYALYAATNKGNLPLESLDGPTYSSKGISRLNPPGSFQNVGGNGAPGALGSLFSGGDPDLVGASSALDFDLSTGTPSARGKISCIKNFQLVASGVEFDPTSGASSGTMDCP